MPVVRGIYYNPTEGGFIGEAAWHFLHAIERLYPEVLESLRDVADSPNALSVKDFIIPPRDFKLKPLTDAEELESWRGTKTGDWAERFNIYVSWIIMVAVGTIEHWREHPESKHPLRWRRWTEYTSDSTCPVYVDSPQAPTCSRSPECSYSPECREILGSLWAIYEKERFKFTGDNWDLVQESQQDFVERTREAFEVELAAYVERTETLAQAKGLRKTPEKTNLEHFDWLVHYQVGGKSYREIAGGVYMSDETEARRVNIAKRVKELAVLLALPLRPRGRPGRPRI